MKLNIKKAFSGFLVLCLILSNFLSVNFVKAAGTEVIFKEDFEAGKKSSYPNGSEVLSSGSWTLDNALFGTLANDKKNGTKSVRAYGSFYMNFDVSDVESVKFFHANFGTDSGATWVLQKSTNSGTTWQDVAASTTITSSLVEVTIPVNQKGNVRFKISVIGGSSSKRLNFDDFTVTKLQTPPADTTAPDSPLVNPVTDKDQLITGTAEAGSTVIAKVNGQEIGRATAGQAGNFTITLTTKLAANVKISVTATDAAGNVSQPTEITVSDATVPEPPVVNPVTDADEVITGIAEVGSTVVAKVNEQIIGQSIASENGNFEIQIAKQLAKTKILVSSQDKFGNISSSTEITVIRSIPKVDLVTLSVDKSSPQELGSTITFHAVSEGSPNPEYRFFVRDENGKLTTLQEYGSNNTISWTPSKTGKYSIIVHAKDKSAYGGNLTFEARGELTYSVYGGKVTSVTVSTDISSPQLPGSPITIKASSVGSSEPEYRFYIRDKDGNLTTLQDYSSKDTAVWTPSNTGAYTIIVHAKDKSTFGGGYSFEARNEIKFIVNSGKVTNVDLVSDLSSPQRLDQIFTFKAVSQGSIEPEYRFFVRDDNGNLTTLQEYSSNDTVTWTPTKTGTYMIIVHAKDKSSNYYESRAEIKYIINSGKVLNVSITTNQASPQLVGSTIHFKVTSNGSLNPEYRFFVKDENGNLTLLQEYSTNDNISWTPLKAGTYTIIVHAKDKLAYGGEYGFEARTEIKYSITN